MNIEQIENSIDKACSRIAPAWPLKNNVAVNPYLGVSDYPFEKAAEMLNQRGDIQLYMPFSFYKEQIDLGKITEKDISKALRKSDADISTEDFLNQLGFTSDGHFNNDSINTISQVAKRKLDTDFSPVTIDQTSAWLSKFFKENDTNEITAQQLFTQWTEEVKYDLYPDLLGLRGMRETLKTVPAKYDAAILNGLDKLQIPENLVEPYLHALLLKLVGWASYAAGLDWQANLHGKKTQFVNAILAILVSWERSIIISYPALEEDWKSSLKESESNNVLSDLKGDLLFKAILQDAYDFAFQGHLQNTFKEYGNQEDLNERPSAQMIFCIDVRSEVYRRNLEATNSRIETIGFAGFFGFPVKYKPLIHQEGKNQCPVLIPAGPEVIETTDRPEYHEKEQKSRSISANIKTAWSKFRSGSTYGFVSPLGIYYLPKLIGDSLGWTQPIKNPKDGEFGHLLSGKGRLDISGISFEDKVNMAQSALTAMGLTKQIAPLVLITGHGSTSVNNPHASGLDCGACGGNSGEINALTAQLILNDDLVRQELKERNFSIPSDTFFLACVHDTTTDEISVINEKSVPESHLSQLQEIKNSLDEASQNSRKYRSGRLGINKKSVDAAVKKRANDWSQVRPEWGLAGCHSFIVAPRSRTKGMDLGGKSFLHSYDWKVDRGFKVLETIMTAPMVVTSWINLQYYASTVDNDKLGAGNKTLHNVTGNLGVFEGSRGDLRIGLPMQSVFDGKNYQHLPIRLNVVIEAPKEVIEQILRKHSNIRELCDHKWISILILNDSGQISHRYAGDFEWEDYLAEQNQELETIEQLVETI